MLFLMPNQQCHSIEGIQLCQHDLENFWYATLYILDYISFFLQTLLFFSSQVTEDSL